MPVRQDRWWRQTLPLDLPRVHGGDLSKKTLQLEDSEMILNSLKRLNAQSAKLIEIGYFLVGFLAILTVCVVVWFLVQILAWVMSS